MKGTTAVALTVALLAVLTPAGGGYPAPRAPEPRLDPSRTLGVPTAVARVSPALVGLRARIPPHRPSAAVLGTERWGSGVLIEPDGIILTVGYVVLEAGELTVELRDGRTIAAQVLGHDFQSGLAVARVAEPGPYPTAVLGRSAPVTPGQRATIVGVGGAGRMIAVAASVTAVRPFVAYWEYLLERALIVAPTHPAFGGAALVDQEGAVLGLVSLRLGGQNLAIPIDLLAPVRQALIRHGRPARAPRPYLGVRTLAVEGGVGVAGVLPAGPADAAGLRSGDVILRLNGDRVADVEDFYRKLWRTAVGHDVELTVYRDGRFETVTVRSQDRHAVFQFRSD